ncbi:MAG: hypothetical protein QOI55_2838, partial [Actinomycetota bacterium]|nr:hypothetical protein [Actinomycetota bacterium]
MHVHRTKVFPLVLVVARGVFAFCLRQVAFDFGKLSFSIHGAHLRDTTASSARVGKPREARWIDRDVYRATGRDDFSIVARVCAD